MTRRAQLRGRAAVRRALVLAARGARPRECCGLLLGAAGRVDFAVAVPNIDKRPGRYRLDPAVHIAVRRLVRRLSPAVAIVGAYHSHPGGDAVPSRTDVAEAMYPDWLWVIVGLRRRAPAVRAYRIRRGRPREVRVRWE